MNGRSRNADLADSQILRIFSAGSQAPLADSFLGVKQRQPCRRQRRLNGGAVPPKKGRVWKKQKREGIDDVAERPT